MTKDLATRYGIERIIKRKLHISLSNHVSALHVCGGPVSPTNTWGLPWTDWQIIVNLSPAITYYVAALAFHIMHQLPAFDKYRVQEETIDIRNTVSWQDALPWVLLQHAIQIFLGLLLALVDPTEGKFDTDLTVIIFKWIVAMFILDTYQYWAHRVMHTNKWLYNNLHSWHHRLHCPYPVGALYNHPAEGLLLDLGSATAALLISKLDLRVASLFVSVSTLKTVCDHSNFHFWWNPLNSLFTNNAVYHNWHHDPRGFRYNFSQPYFMMWDKWMGTQYIPPSHESKKAK